MAEQNGGRDNDGFALGLIVAAILFLLLRREFGKLARKCGCGTGAGVSVTNGQGNGTGAPGGPKCPCPDGCSDVSGLTLPSNPGITLGVGLDDSDWGNGYKYYSPPGSGASYFGAKEGTGPLGSIIDYGGGFQPSA